MGYLMEAYCIMDCNAGIALVGFIDDHLSLEAKTRLIVQSLLLHWLY